MKPLIAITLGDFNGIGPEIAIKAALDPSVRRICTPVLVGPLDVLRHTAGLLRIRTTFEKTTLTIIPKRGIPVLDVGDGIGADVTFGRTARVAGRSAGTAIEKAVELCVQRKVAAMVTAPVSKEGLHLAGYDFPGQTEMVALLSRSRRVLMVLAGKTMRVALATVHAPLRSVPDQLSTEKLVEKGSILLAALKRDFGIRKPNIAVLGLNPHAGENGHIGVEDRDIVGPAVEKLRAEGHSVEGPFPADAFFGTHAYRRFDAILAMYHDQGLIPMKMSGFDTGVNFSAGLQIIRTSPDHGVAFDLAGRNKASTSSMVAAVTMAVSVWKRRRAAHD